MSLLWSVLISLAVLLLGRAMPVRGPRRFFVFVTRLLAIWCALLALRGWTVSHPQAQPRHIVYLVDQSDSIDAAQTQWIARRVASLEAMRPSQVSRSVIAFGAQASVVVPAGRDVLADPSLLATTLARAPLARDDTHLEAGLLAALSTAPQPERTRVILLSDGRQTMGDVERILPHVARLGLEVYPVAPPSTMTAGIGWERLSVPAVVRRGAAVPLRLVFTNGTAASPSANQMVEVTVSVQGLPVARKRARVGPGWQVVSLAIPATKTGTMELEVTATLAPRPAQEGSRRGGHATDGERRTAMVEVEGPPKLLMVVERPSALPPLAMALKRRGMDVALITPAELPTDAGRLLEYDAVMMYQVPKSVVTQPQVDALTDYLSHFGGGLVMVGLGGVLHKEITTPAPLDAVLPVAFEPKGAQEAKRRVSMIMLIDRSASMMGPRIAATKRASVELVRQLAPEDLVGVLAFDTVPYVVVEVQPARRVSDLLIEKLVYLKSTGGTDLFPALQAAQGRLQATGATMQHVILLSDGQTPVDSQAYRRLLGEFKAQHISLSTIGIGPAMVNVELLKWLAEQTGGAFYLMRNLDELPQLIAIDTQQALGRLPFSEGYFVPERPPAAEWLHDVVGWPSLKGYLTTTAKPGAAVELTVRQGEGAPSPEGVSADPLLAHWAVGKGRVTVFTSDAGPRWSAGWIRWPAFEPTWVEILQQTMRRRPNEDLFVWLDDQDAAPSIVIEGDLRDPSAVLVSKDGRLTTPMALVQQGRFRWRAAAEPLASGWYRVMVESHASEAGAASPSTEFTTRWIQIGHAERPREQSHLAADEALLRHVAEATHGVYDVPDRAFLPPTKWVRVPVPLRGLLLPLLLLLVLIDVALRGRSMLSENSM